MTSRRAFLKGMLGGAATAATAGRLASTGGAHAAGATGSGPAAAVPFYGRHQAGITTPAQASAAFLAFDVTAGDRRELADLLRALTARAAVLVHGGAPSAHRDLLGGQVVPDGLTMTVAVGASLFDDRYGLAHRRPAQLKTMRAFAHDDLDPRLSHGDLLVQVCADHRDAVGNAMLDILRHTRGGLRLRWRLDGFRFPPRPVGVPRDWMGFKDGVANPDTTDAAQMDEVVWAAPRGREPAWTAGGTYHVVRIIRMHVDTWDGVPVEEQERIFGRRKVSGAPLYATDPGASDELDPVYTNDPQGRLTPLRCHIRLANPQTPQAAATSTILRRSYQYDASPDAGGKPDVGHAFCCFQRHLDTYVAMQTRLEHELLAPYITPIGGGYFFALPGVRDAQDHYGSALLLDRGR
jgi:deferrochelatase/peroxidase EfeB